MLDTFNAVWTALTTTNEELIKVLLIPLLKLQLLCYYL